MFLTNGKRVFAIVLNYRHPDDTLRCLAALRRSNDRAIHAVIVDNASGDGSVAQLRNALGPAVPILDLPENLGYAGGNNVGIGYALERDADFVWILNPDTEVEPNTLQMLMSTMYERPDAGFVGSLNVLGDSSPPVVQFAGGKVDWESGGVTESIGIGDPLSSIRTRDPYAVDYVAGTSMLVRRRVFEDLGFIPERYFLYFEETDFQLEAAARGWRSYLNPLARVKHHQRSTGALPAPYYVYYYIRGRLLFGRKFTQLSHDDLEAGLAGFIEGWRSRVAQRQPGWLTNYDQLVEWAIADGRAGVEGRRHDVDDVKRPGA